MHQISSLPILNNLDALQTEVQRIDLFKSSVYLTVLIPPFFQDIHDLTLLFRIQEDGAAVSHLWIHGKICQRSYESFIQITEEFKSKYLFGLIGFNEYNTHWYFIFLDNAFHSDDPHLQ